MANFNYTVSVKCVNGTDTWVEFNFKNYKGDLSTDITDISITGPSSFAVSSKQNFTFKNEDQYVWTEFLGVAPSLGDYTFSVTICGETVEYI